LVAVHGAEIEPAGGHQFLDETIYLVSGKKRVKAGDGGTHQLFPCHPHHFAVGIVGFQDAPLEIGYPESLGTASQDILINFLLLDEVVEIAALRADIDDDSLPESRIAGIAQGEQFKAIPAGLTANDHSALPEERAKRGQGIRYQAGQARNILD